MSHHAHGTNRSYGHASRTSGMGTGSSVRHSLYQELHPEMYRAAPKSLRRRRISDDERRAAIIDDLRANGPSTAGEIQRRLRINKKYITPLLTAGIDGVTVVSTRQNRSTIIKVWGMMK